MKSKPDIKQFVSVKAAAEALDCTEQYIYQLISLGTLIGIKIGARAIRVSLESLNAFVDSNTINPEDYRVAPAEEEDQGSRDQGPGFRVQEKQKPAPTVARSRWMERR